MIRELHGEVLVLVVYEADHARLVWGYYQSLTTFVWNDWCIVCGVVCARKVSSSDVRERILIA